MLLHLVLLPKDLLRSVQSSLRLMNIILKCYIKPDLKTYIFCNVCGKVA